MPWLLSEEALRADASALAERMLDEDLHSGDINAELIPANQTGAARIICREACVLAGKPFAEAVMGALARRSCAGEAYGSIRARWFGGDGDHFQANTPILVLEGSARALLSAERSVLNVLQTLSATATRTAELSALIAHTPTKLLDTRKTLPGLRLAQKYAVHCGGGKNHRMGLYDAFLLKENHIAAAGSISAAVHRARALYPQRFLQVEVETLAQIEECLSLGIARVLLDNFSPPQTAEIVARVRQYSDENRVTRMELEASGNIDANSLVAYAEAGVDFISIGALTKHIRAVDLSMRFIQQ